ncbi:MAG: hypothetical protein ACKV19_16540 [Verrucomicrobiales bacterium]
MFRLILIGVTWLPGVVSSPASPTPPPNILSAEYTPRQAVFAARDRCDETVEHLRSIRTDRFLYIRNAYLARPLLQLNAYKDSKSIIQTLRSLHQASQLNRLSEDLLFSPSRPAEELYEWTTDRWQSHNLAHLPSHQPALASLRLQLDHWIAASRDPGRESDSRYDSNMAVYLSEAPAQADTLRQNIALMKQWAREDK